MIGSGPYALKTYQTKQVAEFVPNKNYAGAIKLNNGGLIIKYYSDENALKLDLTAGKVDVAYPNFTPTTLKELAGKPGHQGGQRPRRRDPLHGLQPQDDAGRQRRPEAGDPPGDGLPRSTVTSIANERLRQHRRAAVLDDPEGPRRRDPELQDALRRDAGQGQGGRAAHRGRREDAGQRADLVDAGALRLAVRRRVHRDQASARGERPVQGRPAVDGVGPVLQGLRAPTSTRSTSSAGSRTTRTPTTTWASSTARRRSSTTTTSTTASTPC